MAIFVISVKFPYIFSQAFGLYFIDICALLHKWYRTSERTLSKPVGVNLGENAGFPGGNWEHTLL